MPSCEVQRTLVKSPPELWAELSDPASLAKHLGEFGEIRTVRVEPETAVEWESEDVRGVVELKASGWGTKVTLTAVRERAAEETPAEELEPSELAMPDELTPAALPAAAEREVEAEPEWSEALIESERAPERRPSLFARLFRRRRKAQSTSEREALDTATPTPLAAEEEPLAAEEPVAVEEHLPVAVEEPAPLEASEREPEAEPMPTRSDRPDLAAELAQVEQAMVEQDTALLTAVLDRLGAAHHRPFSRG